MLYNIGNVLECKNSVNTVCLEMTNPCFDIKPGDRYIVTDRHVYSIGSSWYELTSESDGRIILSAWNDEGHMVIDDNFNKIK